MRKTAAKFFRRRALELGRNVGLWRKLARPSLQDWAEYLRRHGGFHAFGNNCAINPSTFFSGTHLISIGDNVRIAGAWLNTHDGSVNMINRAYGCKLDAVGSIRIGSDVFIGYGTIVLPGTEIGNRVLVGAGAVVKGRIEENSVVVGSPAKKIMTLDALVERMQARHDTYPWREIVERRAGEYDPALEPELARQRQAYFFPD